MTMGATWTEVNESAREWVVPATRMKGGGEFKVPLSDAALAILDELRLLRRPELGDYIFPGVKRGKHISNMTMAKVLARLGVHVDVHGFRSSFRDWAGEATGHASDVAEAALDHVLPGGETRSAYQRGDLLRKRRDLMDDWAEFLGGSRATAASAAIVEPAALGA